MSSHDYIGTVIEPTLIDGAYYGRSYELGITTCEDGTVCNAVDTGTIFVAYKGVWYEQPGSFWAASLSSSGTLGLSTEIGKITPADDLELFDAVDTGARYVSFQGRWYKQPVQWSAPASGGGGGSSSGGVLVVNITDDGTTETLDKTWQEIYDALESGSAPMLVFKNSDGYFLNQWQSVEGDEGNGYSVYCVNRQDAANPTQYWAESSTGYPSYQYQ